MRVVGQRHAPANLTPRKKTQNKLHSYLTVRFSRICSSCIKFVWLWPLCENKMWNKVWGHKGGEVSDKERKLFVSCAGGLTGKYELRRTVKKLYQLRPELSTPNMTSCVPRLVRNCISCIERYGCTKCPTIGRFLRSFIVFMFLISPISSYCYGLMKTLSPERVLKQ